MNRALPSVLGPPEMVPVGGDGRDIDQGGRSKRAELWVTWAGNKFHFSSFFVRVFVCDSFVCSEKCIYDTVRRFHRQQDWPCHIPVERLASMIH